MDIKKISEDFDQAIVDRDIEKILSFFHDECEIELLDQKLKGKIGARQWIDWLYSKAPKIYFKPSVIICEGNIFYEEFYAIITLSNGKIIKSHQAETLIYEDGKLKILRIFFNPLDFADIVAKDPITKLIVKKIKKKSIEGLV